MGYAAALAIASLLVTPNLPVRARLVAAPMSQVELTNTGDRAITAWSFAVVSPTQTGSHREVHSADVYLSEVTRGLPNSNDHLDWLRPGQSRMLPVDAATSGASVQIVAVVLDDGTGLGDSDTVASIFAHRVAERDELKNVVDTFTAALQTRHGVDALEELRRRLTPVADGDESVPHRSAREAVNAWLQRAKTATSEEDVERSVRTYIAFVTRQFEAASRHAVRKGG